MAPTSNTESTSETTDKGALGHNKAATENEDKPDSDQDQELASKCVNIIIVYVKESSL